MEHEFEAEPTPPGVKIGAGLAAALVVAFLANAVGFVDLSPFGGDDDTPVEVEGGEATAVPESLAFDEDEAGDATRPTVVERLELNSDDTIPPSTTVGVTTTAAPTTTDAGSATTSPGTGEGDGGSEEADDGDGDSQGAGEGDDETDDTIPPQFDENGDPIPVPDDEQPTDNEPVHRTYNDYGSGSS